MTTKHPFNLGCLTWYCVAKLAVTSSAVAAQERIDWYTIDCGGGSCSGAGYHLSATIGQHDASASTLGGGVNLSGGYWPGSETAPPCPADFNGNGTVDTPDLTLFLGRFGQPATPGSLAEQADFNGNGTVDTPDLTYFLVRFGNACA